MSLTARVYGYCYEPNGYTCVLLRAWRLRYMCTVMSLTAIRYVYCYEPNGYIRVLLRGLTAIPGVWVLLLI